MEELIYMSFYLIFKMTQVKLDKEIAKDLITSKLRTLQGYIDSILNRWNEQSTKEFLKKAKNWIYSEAEIDAIELRQFLLDYSKYQNLLTDLDELTPD